MIPDPRAIREELDTLGKRFIDLVERFGGTFDALHEDYTRAILLYLREYEGIHLTLEEIRKVRVNLTSLHRTITEKKKLFQDDGDRVRSDNAESSWRVAVRGWDG